MKSFVKTYLIYLALLVLVSTFAAVVVVGMLAVWLYLGQGWYWSACGLLLLIIPALFVEKTKP